MKQSAGPTMMEITKAIAKSFPASSFTQTEKECYAFLHAQEETPASHQL
jgi:hypothetical protein